MKKKKITYGVPGMMEFETMIIVGSQPTKVSFTGGSINAMGSHPAKYTTDSLMMQHSIERSKQFRTGLIQIVRVVELNEDVKVERNPVGEGSKSEEVKIKNEETQVSEESVAEEAGEADSGLIHVEFEMNDDAKDYLEEKFGVSKSKLINRAAIIEAGKQHGVDIVFV